MKVMLHYKINKNFLNLDYKVEVVVLESEVVVINKVLEEMLELLILKIT